MDVFHFNYIITIHNKENLIADVVLNTLKCMSSPNSTLYTVLDGCTDNSEKIVDGIINTFNNFKIVKLYGQDVHELISINIALNNSNQIGEGFNIILQDDVILQQTNIEELLTSLYYSRKDLGVISFRHGGNLSRSICLSSKPIYPIIQYVENEIGHNPNPFTNLSIGQFVYKEIAIKSPICIPSKVVRDVGIPDENFAPWDDIEYCYRVSEAGFNNAVFGIKFVSKVEWGTTRNKKQEDSITAIHEKNLKLFKLKHEKLLLNKNIRNIYHEKKEIIFKSENSIEFSFWEYSKAIRKIVIINIKMIYKRFVK